MNKDQQEFLKQINMKIKNLEYHLKDEIDNITDNLNTIDYLDSFNGLSKYAEKITVIKGQIEVLKEQKNIFEVIFKAE
jgi:hypothetical protein